MKFQVILLSIAAILAPAVSAAGPVPDARAVQAQQQVEARNITEARGLLESRDKYASSCPSAWINDVYRSILQANCRDKGGNLHLSTIDFKSCLANRDGNLVGAEK